MKSGEIETPTAEESIEIETGDWANVARQTHRKIKHTREIIRADFTSLL
jgi:hypothetical protein